MPIPETEAERAAVASALERWGDEFWLAAIVDDGRESVDDLPSYVAALMPDIEQGADLHSL